jgi:hypothetical protein
MLNNLSSIIKLKNILGLILIRIYLLYSNYDTNSRIVNPCMLGDETMFCLDTH